MKNYNLVILSNNDWTIYEDANYDHHPDRRKIKTGPKIVIQTGVVYWSGHYWKFYIRFGGGCLL